MKKLNLLAAAIAATLFAMTPPGYAKGDDLDVTMDVAGPEEPVDGATMDVEEEDGDVNDSHEDENSVDDEDPNDVDDEDANDIDDEDPNDHDDEDQNDNDDQDDGDENDGDDEAEPDHP